jgi:hypothetical protein
VVSAVVGRRASSNNRFEEEAEARQREIERIDAEIRALGTKGERRQSQTRETRGGEREGGANTGDDPKRCPRGLADSHQARLTTCVARPSSPLAVSQVQQLFDVKLDRDDFLASMSVLAETSRGQRMDHKQQESDDSTTASEQTTTQPVRGGMEQWGWVGGGMVTITMTMTLSLGCWW